MNLKSNILTICLTTFALLAPQKVFGLEQQSHNEINLLCVRKEKYLVECVESKKQMGVQKTEEIKSSTSLTSATPASNTNGIALHKQYSHTNTYEMLLMVVLVSSFSLWLLLYNKQRKNRVAVMRQNIEALERLWKISNYH